MAEAVEEVIKQKGLLRRGVEAATILVERKNEQDVLTFPASSEEPVDRWYGIEVLSHDKGAIRLDRANSGAMPLLFNHNVDDPIGMITGARMENNRLMVDAQLFSTDRAAQVKTMIDGGLRNVSLAYRINKIEEDVNTETYTITDWEPYEVSIVTVPADPTVGIGRMADVEYEVRMVRASKPAPSATVKERAMTEEEKAAAAAAAAAGERKLSAVEAEKERRTAIVHLCKSNKIDARIEARWIEDGTPLTIVAKEILDVMEERGRQKPVAASAVGLSAKETQKYSIFRAIRALKFGTTNPKFFEEAGFEIECSRAVAKQLNRDLTSNILIPGEVLQRPLGEAASRAMATQPGSKGGYLVNVENMGFIDILRNRSVAMSMGARNLSGLVGNVTFSRQTGKPSITWQGGDGSSVTAADQTLGQLSMTPKTAIAITDVSEQLLRQSTPSAEQFVMADLAADIAIDGVDYCVINGTGGAQPLGIKNTTGITSGQDAASATYAKILAFVSTAGGSNAIRSNPGWLANTAGAAKLMQVQRFTSTDTPLWTGNMLDGECVGFRAMSSEQLASGNLIFGSFGEIIIGDWGVLELAMDNGGTRFNQAQVGIRAMWMVDVLLRYPQAFVVSTNLS
ncbi:MAG TPA: phage major capsid protein [Nitrospira sp.]|nr:phage major capsid protein [Nitrospira sp.]